MQLVFQKKTLIQVEKQRLLLSWTATCAVCVIFRNSKLLRNTLGEDPSGLVETLAHEGCYAFEDTGNKSYLFWDVIEDNGLYSIQKNIISEHYKIIDKEGKRYFSSFDKQKIHSIYNNVILEGDKYYE